MNKYQRMINDDYVDVYDILAAFDVRCPATAHAIKKLLMPGQRGDKSKLQDLQEARLSINRAIELEEQRLTEPCPSCASGHTGLPEGACEDCMTTRLARPETIDIIAKAW